ncbi:HdaA/DnaA family protein [Sphingomicrobium nitratireducens]|uniref:HdaA/DnaA family protein n=1 Tax=Sphingomicrobium nitratireducens TaxID=2964666 RepID=UPI002240DC62|nr:DnaA/Hda family protein [Sphingomicrobium nitratireducens]
MARVDQIALPLDWPQGRDAARFIPSPANAQALDHLERWSLWPVKATIITGPRRSGRSLLARLFTRKIGGRLFDDAERHDEEELFHAWNHAQETGLPLVMVADSPPPAWEPALPDLRTRLAVTPVTTIEQPDDQLFESLLGLHFADRGLHLPDEARRYIAARVERTYWNAEQVVDQIDRHAMADRARLTIPTIRKALGMTGGEADGEA